MKLPLLKILLVEDDEEDYLIVRDFLSKTKGRRFELTWAPTYEAGLEQIRQGDFAAILVDYNLNRRTGLEFIQEVMAQGLQVPIIFLTGQGNYEVDLQAMQAGAADYLTKKEINAPLLERSIRYAVEHKQTELKLRRDAARAELLSNLSRDFAESGFDTLGMIHKISRRISETFGDAIMIRILTEDGKTLEPAAIYHPDPQARERMEELLSTTLQLVGEGVVGEAALSQKPRLLCDMPVEELARLTKAEFLPWFEQYPVDSFFVMPLCSQTRLIGTLVVVRNTPGGQLQPDDQAFYLDLANRAAMAIENSKLHNEIQRLALTDSLTGVFNRRGFAQLAQREIDRYHRYGAPLSIIMLDIDHFKDVNDTYGHIFGDEVLKALTECCTINIRKMDIVGRFGGDEFVILLPDTDIPMAWKVANRIGVGFAESTLLSGDEQVHLTASFGITQASKDTKDIDLLIKKVDTVLYQAKKKGRNRVEIL